MYVYFKSRIDKRLSSESLHEEMRKEVSSIIQELNRTTDRNISLIENRISLLKGILDTADKKILLLRRETGKSELSARMYEKIVQKPETPPSIEEVMSLYRQGISSDIIANKLGKPLGEVEVLIALGDHRGKK
jgi:hypothetical protein